MINKEKQESLSYTEEEQFRQFLFELCKYLMSRERSRDKKKNNRSRSRSHEKDRRQKRGEDRHDYGRSYDDRRRNDNNRRDNRFDREERGRYNDNWNRDRSYNNNRNYQNRPQQKNKPKVHLVEVQSPKTFILSDSSFSGKLKLKILKEPHQPQRVQKSELGDLKNKITPIEKLWSSHIKQYLNISQFVEIFRPRKSLAYEPIEYGKTIINYQQDFNCIEYNNLTEQAQIFSRAYFKLWQILQTGVLDDTKDKPLSIGCVAQGPGGFIHALIDYRLRQQRNETKLQRDTYNAITLKIEQDKTRHAKDWSDPRGFKLFKRLREIGQSINLSYGKTETGDLLLTENIQYFAGEVKTKCQLVTGDGGIQCIGDKQFQYQEVFNAKLFLGEIVTAFHIQDIHGKFILKIYDVGFELTRQLILLLSLYYVRVKIIKPITSRPGNSEKYLLCEDFRGISEEQLSLLKEALRQWTAIEPNLTYFENSEFVHSIFDFSECQNYEEVYRNIKEANDWFVDEQIRKIEEGLQLSEKHRESARSIEDELRETRWTEQISFAYAWCKRYGLPTIQVDLKDVE